MLFYFECQVSIEAEDLVAAIDKFHTNAENLDWSPEVLVNEIQGYEQDVINEAYLKWHNQ